MRIEEKILSRLSENDPTLTYLNLNNQNLDDNDVLILCEALKTNTHLKTLKLGFNDIGSVGVKALAENTTLETLYLTGNDIPQEALEALEANTTLTSCYYSYMKHPLKPGLGNFILLTYTMTVVNAVYFADWLWNDAIHFFSPEHTPKIQNIVSSLQFFSIKQSQVASTPEEPDLEAAIPQ